MRALIAVALLLLAACAEEAAAPPPCEGPSCGGGGSGGGDPCPDLSARGACDGAGPNGGCAEGEACTVRSRACAGGGTCCTLAPSCEPDEGPRPGGFRCERDDDCASGLCHTTGGVGICLRPCTVSSASDSCPEGFTCRLVPLEGQKTVRACVGGTEAAPDAARTLCRASDDCGPGRACRVQRGEDMDVGLAFGACEPTATEADAGTPCEGPEGPDGPVPSEVYEASASCAEGGLCNYACETTKLAACACSGAELAAGRCSGARCTKPCRNDAECPSRNACRSFDTAYDRFEDPALAFQVCMLPLGVDVEWGCWDELDCCTGGLQRNGQPCCDVKNGSCVGAQAEVTHCRIEPGEGRFMAYCRQPSGLAALGDPCAGHAGCESGLCAPDGAGGGRCASPCDLALDHCETIQPGTACCPVPLGELCVPGCSASCPAEPACEPS